VPLEKAEDLEPEPKEWAIMVVKLGEGLGMTAAGIEVFEGADWNKQVETTGQGIVKMLACCKELLKEEERSSTRQTLVLGNSR